MVEAAAGHWPSAPRRVTTGRLRGPRRARLWMTALRRDMAAGASLELRHACFEGGELLARPARTALARRSSSQLRGRSDANRSNHASSTPAGFAVAMAAKSQRCSQLRRPTPDASSWRRVHRDGAPASRARCGACPCIAYSCHCDSTAYVARPQELQFPLRNPPQHRKQHAQLTASLFADPSHVAWARARGCGLPPEPAGAHLPGNVGAVTASTGTAASRRPPRARAAGGLDYSHSSGFYVGNWTSNDRVAEGRGLAPRAMLELDLYGGYKESSSEASASTSAICATSTRLRAATSAPTPHGRGLRRGIT